MTQISTEFTNIQALDPTIIVDLRYATTNNFTQQIIYDFTTAIARTGTAQKLAQANKILKTKGYCLKVWDAYRPITAQKKLFEVYPDPKFVAPPNPNFSHQKGVTFDVTLCDLNGTEVKMPTLFDDFSDQAHRSIHHPSDVTVNYQILDDAMQKAGFVGYENEWWDYRDNDMDNYGPATANPNDYQL